MIKNLMIKLTLAIFAFVLLGSLNVSAQKKTDCSVTTDEQIVKAVYDRIKTKKYADQIIHINVTATGGAVTLVGWATTEKYMKQIEKLVSKTKCVKSVTNKLTIGVGGGCGPGTKTCGGICIATTDSCNICTARSCN